ncbi:MAG: winged helix-turn-helix domain-containing protein [Deltaproteobacteria bacterium]|nr:winged helix-turn-helix domain-containing protein [Deltaproteobacteria bacterium]
MSTLPVVEEVLRENRVPMVVKEIVVAAGLRLPTKSKTPDTVVARDLAMDIKRHGPESKFARVAPGRYTLREYALDVLAQAETSIGGSIEVVNATESSQDSSDVMLKDSPAS